MKEFMSKWVYIAGNGTIAVAAASHAWFIVALYNDLKWNTVAFHCLQWSGMLLGALGFSMVAVAVYDDWHRHSVIGKIGRCLVPFMVAAAVYVMTLEMLQ